MKRSEKLDAEYADFFRRNWQTDFLSVVKYLKEVVRLSEPNEKKYSRGIVWVSFLDHPMKFVEYVKTNHDKYWEMPGFHDLMQSYDPADEIVVVFVGPGRYRILVLRREYLERTRYQHSSRLHEPWGINRCIREPIAQTPWK